MNLIEVRGTDTTAQDGVVVISRVEAKAVGDICNALTGLLPKRQYAIHDHFEAKTREVIILVQEPDGARKLVLEDLRDARDAVSRLHQDFVTRYSEAYIAQLPVIPIATDVKVRELNKLTWLFERLEAAVYLAPGTEFEVQLRAYDPEKLQCDVPEPEAVFEISEASVTGVREVSRGQRGLFDPTDVIDVIVSLAGNTSEVLLRTTRDEAQHYYRGENKMSLVVRKVGTKIPVAEGHVKLHVLP